MKQLTMSRLVDSYNKIIDKVYADCAGGTKYGVDWPTLCALFPARAKAIRNIRALARKLQ